MRIYSLRFVLLALAFIIAVLLLGLNLATTPAASPEWVYTLKWINYIAGPLIPLLIFICARQKTVLFCGLATSILVAIPLFSPYYFFSSWQFQYFLSACWAAAFLAGAITLFLVVSNK